MSGNWMACPHCEDTDLKEKNYEDHLKRVHPSEYRERFGELPEEPEPDPGSEREEVHGDTESIPGIESKEDKEIGFLYTCESGHVHLHLHGREVQLRRDGCVDIALSSDHAEMWANRLRQVSKVAQ